MLTISNVSDIINIILDVGNYIYSFFFIMGDLFMFPMNESLGSYAIEFISPITNLPVTFSFGSGAWLADIIQAITGAFTIIPNIACELLGGTYTFGMAIISTLVVVCIIFWIIGIVKKLIS